MLCGRHIEREQKEIEIVSEYSIAHSKGLLTLLIKVNKGVLTYDKEETELLLHPCQAMEFGCKFNLAPIGCEDEKGEARDSRLSVNDLKLPFQYDRRKLFFKLRKPTEEELSTTTPIILISPKEYEPDIDSYLSQIRRRKARKYQLKISLEDWKKRLALAPENTMWKILEATTHLTTNVEDDNRNIMK